MSERFGNQKQQARTVKSFKSKDRKRWHFMLPNAAVTMHEKLDFANATLPRIWCNYRRVHTNKSPLTLVKGIHRKSEHF